MKFFVSHHLYPENAQVFVINLEQIIPKGAYGELYWHLVIYTSALGTDGKGLGPFYYNVYSDEETLNTFIESKVKDICEQIDWEKSWYDGEYTEGIDTAAPRPAWHFPARDQKDVPIRSMISVRLRDELPSKGIRLNSITMTINDITIYPKVSGHKYDCVVSFKPAVGK